MVYDDKNSALPRLSHSENKRRPGRWQRRLLGAACILAGMTLLALAGVHWYHPKLLYRPSAVPSSESAYFAQYPDLKVEPRLLVAPDNVKLRTYWFPSSKVDRPVLYFLYGSDGNMEYTVEHIKRIRGYADWNVFLLAYRGYGFSEGHPSMRGIQMDVEAGLDYILNNLLFSRDKVIVYGHSFGGAAALHLAAKRPSSFGTLIVESTFASVREMASILFPKWSWLLFLVTENWDNKAQIDKLIEHAVAGERMPKILTISVGNDQMLSQMKLLEGKLRGMPSNTLVQRLYLPEAAHYGFFDSHYFKGLTRCVASDKPDCS